MMQQPRSQQVEGVRAPGLRVLEHLYTFDHRIARCDDCALRDRRETTECLSARPERWNGLMVVGEGPGFTEARLKVPFVGASGKLLDVMLSNAGLERAETYVANATLCQPTSAEKVRDRDAQLDNAVQRCRSRLFAEIEHYQPRVILALGQYALDALTGVETRVDKRTSRPCEACAGVHVFKLWGCAKCKTVYQDKPVGAALDPAGKPRRPAESTPCCGAKWQPRNVPCAACGGAKTTVTTEHRWKSAYKIGEVAGGLWAADKLPIAQVLKVPSETYVIATYHPSFMLRKTETKSQKQIGGQFVAAAAQAHVKKAKRLLTEKPHFAFTWREVTPEQLESYVRDPQPSYAVDVETDAKSAHEVTDIRCVGISREDAADAIVVDTEGLAADHPRVCALRAFLTDPSKRKIFHNGIYDCAVIERVWNTCVDGYAFDTLIAHNVVAPDEPHDLGHVGFLYTDAEPWKPPKAAKNGGLVFGSKEERHAYCARDVRVTALSQLALRRELRAERVSHVHDIDLVKFRLAERMTRVGMPVDRKRMLEVGLEAQYRAEQALRELRQMVGRIPDALVAKGAGPDRAAFEFNPHAPHHLAWALYDPTGPFKLIPSGYTATGQPSTDKTALLAHVEHPFVEALMRFKVNHKIKATWIDGAVLGPDQRLHPQWNPIGARTGRWSCSPNMMNVPKWVRAMVVAPPGRVIVGADFSQLELRITASLSGDPEMIRRCRDAVEDRKLEPDYDPHSFVASISLGRAFTDLIIGDPKHDKTNSRCRCQTCVRKHLRNITKRTVYGLNYGAGAETVLEAIYDGGYDGPPIDVTTIVRTIEAYFKAFPGVSAWRDKVLREAQRTGYVRDALIGRFRVFPLGNPDATVCYNFPIQATAASVMDLGTLDFDRALSRIAPNAFIFAQVHDALYVECDEADGPRVADALGETLSCDVQLVDGAAWMPLPAVPHVAADWQSAA